MAGLELGGPKRSSLRGQPPSFQDEETGLAVAAETGPNSAPHLDWSWKQGAQKHKGRGTEEGR